MATLAVGAGLFWTLVATVVGSAFGTFFVAFPSAQGPHLGLPQLVVGNTSARRGPTGAIMTGDLSSSARTHRRGLNDKLTCWLHRSA